MSDEIQDSQGESYSLPFRTQPTDEETPLQDLLPICAEDLVKLGVESRLIPSIVSTTFRAGQSLNGSPSLNPASVVETLGEVHLSA